MQKNILWTGIAYRSLENCIVTITAEGSETSSSIAGEYDGILYKLEYRIRTNRFWETLFFEITSQCQNRVELIRFLSDGKGNWSSDGQPLEKFNGCIDIDISLTPFTNTLPINRLTLAENQQEQIPVLYLDILGRRIIPVQQKYTRLSPESYKYENVPNDFESIISVDESGLVVKYPGLFERSSITDSDYRQSSI